MEDVDNLKKKNLCGTPFSYDDSTESYYFSRVSLGNIREMSENFME